MARFDEGFFNGKDGVRLYWTSELPEQPRAHVAIVHGYGDHIGRYRYVTDALTAQGFAVHGFDYRGHGRAGGRRGFCDSWSDYLDDLTLFWQRVRQAAGSQKTFLLGHSHGGLMAVHQLERGLEGVSGLILTAPYFKLALTPPAAKVMAARLVGKVVPWLPIATGLTPESLTRDEEAQRLVRQDPLYNRDATPRWFIQSAAAQAQVMALAPRLKVPLILLCGGDDGVASTPAARLFFEAVGAPDKVYKEYPGMRHEPLNEVGREEVFREISGWISAHL